MTVSRGTIVYASDPFREGDAGRPWVVVNEPHMPFHGEQYIALTLTTRSWLDGLVRIPEEAWTRGGTPERGRIVPWGVQSLDADDIEYWQGRTDRDLLDDAVEALIDEIS